ncbi:sigma-54-dependent Fis family transcriptional regulator [Candidatus Aerophobetes bacterium]|uniref:Sigma-54-dependent Fis family transcriptional regulator n=1 Tax=Aerophobetes bacterium TaxID=2030807 RepID=A0A523W2A1_UNCAE|nr:MAG: sigma-54-dependent Fis family transcriptional regulator [Candidatus Aerophobetes bacterium]
MPQEKILLVDDEPNILEMLSVGLEDEEYRILEATDGKEALAQVKKEKPCLVLLDIRMPDMDGIQVLRQIKEIDKAISVIMITGYGGMETVLETMKLGAYDYLTKPVNLEKVKVLVRRALEAQRLAQEVTSLRSKLEEKYKLENIVGKHPRMFEVYKMMGRVMNNKATVLILGETGTGKEVVAQGIHFNGLLKDGPFVAVDCASLPSDLLESELFGHEKGAFTNAIAQKVGKFELANKGTLFLDEIGNLSLATQVRLLRFLQERRIERVGGTKSIELDVRIIAATNLDLERAVKEGSFREDLYYRLNVVTIPLPPLRERRDDIPLFVEHFLQKFKSESGGKVKRALPETMDLLMRYSWPGNVRELENVIERAIVIGKSEAVLVEDLPLGIQKEKVASSEELDVSPDKVPFDKKVEDFEKKLITQALEKANWVQTKAAKGLGTTRSIMKYKMKKYGIERGNAEDNFQSQSHENPTKADLGRT